RQRATRTALLPQPEAALPLDQNPWPGGGRPRQADWPGIPYGSWFGSPIGSAQANRKVGRSLPLSVEGWNHARAAARIASAAGSYLNRKRRPAPVLERRPRPASRGALSCLSRGSPNP